MFGLADAGTYVEPDNLTWQHYRTIELAIEWGFDVVQSQYELHVALLRANAIDDETADWFAYTAIDAIDFLQGITYPGMLWAWENAELVLHPDFHESDFEIEGVWYADELPELYGTSLSYFQEYIDQLGFDIEPVDDKQFKVIQKYV